MAYRFAVKLNHQIFAEYLMKFVHSRRVSQCLPVLFGAIVLLCSFNATADVICAPPKVLQVNGGGALEYFGAHPDCYAQTDPGNVFNKTFSSIGDWGSAVQQACVGTIFNLDATFTSNPYFCDSHNEVCMNGTWWNSDFTQQFSGQAAQGLLQCAQGYYVVADHSPDPGPKCPACGDPINPGDGNEFRMEEDFRSGDGNLAFRRNYNSSSTLQSQLGANWQHNFSRQLVTQYSTLLAPPEGQSYVSSVRSSISDTCTLGWAEIAAASSHPTATATFSNGVCQLSTGDVLPIFNTDMSAAWTNTQGVEAALSLQRPDGKNETFYCANGTCTGRSNVPIRVTASSAGFVVVDEHDTTETYTTSGLLTSTTTTSGYSETIARNTDGTISTVTDNKGRQLVFSYTSGILSSLTLPDGSQVGYGHDTSGRLITVTYPGGVTKTYGYTNGKYPNALTSIVDENNTTYASLTYDGSGRANYSSLGGGIAGTTSIIYGTNSAAVTDASGTTRTYAYQIIQGRPEITSISGTGCDSCGATKTINYDASGYVQTRTSYNNILTNYSFDDIRGLETQRVEGSGTVAQRTVTSSWNSNFRVPMQHTISTASGVESMTKWVYNARGQATTRCDIDPSDSLATGYTCSATTAPPAGAKVRRWVYTYCDTVSSTCPLIGLLLSVDGPRTDIADTTSYSYYPTTDESGCATLGGACHHLGDLYRVTNALGQYFTYVSYDKNGRVTRTLDINALSGTGIYVDTTYTSRGWLSTRTIRANNDGTPNTTLDATTTFNYDNVGNVVQIQTPDLVGDIAYAYDAAHRLIKISDHYANSIQYTLDAAGNRIAEKTYDGLGTLKRSLARQYDQLNRLTAFLNNAGAAVQSYVNPVDAPPSGITYTDGYDGNGNAIYSVDGNSVGTEQQYDPLNRLVKTLQDHAGAGATHNTTTQYAYDARDNLRSVTDPDNLTTSYTYDGLNNLTALSGPDAGNWSYTYDAAGNRKTQTDARGIVTNYTYDALNRLTNISYPTSSLNVTYNYDQASVITGCAVSYRYGKLTSFTDSSGSTTYCYDRQGNVLSKKQITNGITLSTSYTYSLSNRLLSITYPSGALVTYGRDTDGRVTSVTYKASSTATPITVVSNVTYYAYGPLATIFFGNGRQLTKTYDQDYNIDKIVSSNAPVLTIDATVDVMGNLTGASSTIGASPPTVQYQYDPLYRLSSFQTGTTTTGFTYGPSGDRTSETVGGTLTGYTYTSGTHHLATVGSQTRSYDANGNTTLISGRESMTYDDRNRLATVHGLAYNYNAKGERVSDPNALYVYDESGKNLGSYRATGVMGSEYIYLDNIPIGLLYVDQTVVYYVETDQLGTPRQVIHPGATASSDTLVGSWSYFSSGVFGEQGWSGTVPSNLRFPGQQYDSNSTLFYNYFRDYDPFTGRYIESDPIGLDGGISTYAYANSNPLKYTDPTGEQAAAAALGFGGEYSGAVACPVCLAVAGSGLGGWYIGSKFYENNADTIQNTIDSVVTMASPGNVSDTQITTDWGKANSDAKLRGCPPPDRCKWLEDNASKYRPDQVKATAKAWGCRGSRLGRGGKSR